MHVEFITDDDTEDAFFEWCARRRRDVIPGWLFLLGFALLAGCDYLLWRSETDLSGALVVAMVAQVAAIVVATVARDPKRATSLRCPHAEVTSLCLIAASFVISFQHRTSILAFLMIAITVTAAAALGVYARHGFAIVHRFVEHPAHVVHAHLDGAGIDVQVRPSPTVRYIRWTDVRGVGLDDESLFVVAGWTPVVIPRRAFLTRDAWEQFTQVTMRSVSALKSQKRTPIWRHVRSSKARGA